MPGTLDNRGQRIDPGALRFVNGVYSTAEQRAYGRLVQMCRPCTSDASYGRAQLRLWRRPGTMDNFLAVLRTHPAITDGYTYPGFAFAGFGSDFDIADARRLGAPTPKAGFGPAKGYRGLMTSFEDGNANGTGRWSWNGMTQVP